MAPAAVKSIITLVSSSAVLAQITPANAPSGLESIMRLGLTGTALLACWVLWQALSRERKEAAAAMADERKTSAAAIAVKDAQLLEMAKQVTQLLAAIAELRGSVRELREEHMGVRRRQQQA